VAITIFITNATVADPITVTEAVPRILLLAALPAIPTIWIAVIADEAGIVLRLVDHFD
jgi:hypothetical protein